ncbi:MAG: OstA-like protein, partial [Bacteroidales bacterium]
MTIVQRIITLFTCMAFLVSGFAQKKVQQIEIVHADYTMMDKSINPDAQMLIGDVVFKHENAIMKCDSAYYYPNSNYVEAFDNIHINQGDTLHLYGDFLIYSGIEKLAKVRRNVKLVDKQSTLTTQYLDFNLGEDFAYYINGGHIINGENNLDSETGYYYSKRKVFYFKDSVVIVNPDYNMYSDTLRYNTVSKVAFFLGPTEIISKNNYIYCENGWYNTETNISQFEENAFIRGEHRTISGDSLYYERDNGFGEAFMNVVINDTLDKIILNGNYARYYENPE